MGGRLGPFVGAPGLTVSRHLLYTTHFPLPMEEWTTHEINQRSVLLFGVGRTRDEARHLVKKINKEVTRLFNKKFSIDVAEGTSNETIYHCYKCK